jgi:hypothetical protein
VRGVLCAKSLIDATWCPSAATGGLEAHLIQLRRYLFRCARSQLSRFGNCVQEFTVPDLSSSPIGLRALPLGIHQIDAVAKLNATGLRSRQGAFRAPPYLFALVLSANRLSAYYDLISVGSEVSNDYIEARIPN